MRRHFIALYLLLGLLTLALVVGFVWLLSVERSIQTERHDSIVSACMDQNRRHDATINQLNAEGAAAIKKQPGQAAQIKHTVKQFELIFAASTPKQNCQAIADRYVHPQGG